MELSNGFSEQVKDYKYLGSTVNNRGNKNDKLNQWIQEANNIICMTEEILESQRDNNEISL